MNSTIQEDIKIDATNKFFEDLIKALGTPFREVRFVAKKKRNKLKDFDWDFADDSKPSFTPFGSDPVCARNVLCVVHCEKSTLDDQVELSLPHYAEGSKGRAGSMTNKPIKTTRRTLLTTGLKWKS